MGLLPSKITATALLAFLIYKTCRPAYELGSEPGDRVADKLARRAGRVSKLAKWFILPLVLAYLLWTLHAPVERHPLKQPWHATEVAGLLIAVIGWCLRLWSMQTLGRLFTFELGIRKDHKLIQSGPYRLLRHPSYTGLLLGIFGTCTFFRLHHFVPCSTAIGCLPVALLLPRRLQNEEEMMNKEFKEAWETYAHKTWRLVPFVY